MTPLPFVFLIGIVALICDVSSEQSRNTDLSVQELVRSLGDRDTAIQRQSANKLAEIGANAIPALIAALACHANDDVSPWISHVLVKIGSPSVPSLTRELQNPNARVRSFAITTLHEIGSPSRSAITELVHLLNDEDADVQRRAIGLLGYLGSDLDVKTQKAVTLDLIGLLRTEPSQDVRAAAILAIGIFGPNAKRAIPALIEIVTDPMAYFDDWEICSLPGFMAARSLSRIGSETAVPLSNIVASPKYSKIARKSASQGLMLLGHKASPAISNLTNTLGDSDPDIRGLAARVLGEIGPNAKAAMPRLVEALKDQARIVQVESAMALRKIEPGSRVALPALRHCLKDQQKLTRRQAAMALGMYGADAKDAVGDLVAFAADEDPRMRAAAIRALGEIGPSAIAAVGTLYRMALDDGDPSVREWALESMRRIVGNK